MVIGCKLLKVFGSLPAKPQRGGQCIPTSLPVYKVIESAYELLKNFKLLDKCWKHCLSTCLSCVLLVRIVHAMPTPPRVCTCRVSRVHAHKQIWRSLSFRRHIMNQVGMSVAVRVAVPTLQESHAKALLSQTPWTLAHHPTPPTQSHTIVAMGMECLPKYGKLFRK